MRTRFVRRFEPTFTKGVDDVITDYLDKNPEYCIKAMTYMHQGMTYGALVYFELIDDKKD